MPFSVVFDGLLLLVSPFFSSKFNLTAHLLIPLHIPETKQKQSP